MKKIYPVLITVLILFTLTGCSKNQEEVYQPEEIILEATDVIGKVEPYIEEIAWNDFMEISEIFIINDKYIANMTNRYGSSVFVVFDKEIYDNNIVPLIDKDMKLQHKITTKTMNNEQFDEIKNLLLLYILNKTEVAYDDMWAGIKDIKENPINNDIVMLVVNEIYNLELTLEGNKEAYDLMDRDKIFELLSLITGMDIYNVVSIIDWNLYDAINDELIGDVYSNEIQSFIKQTEIEETIEE